MLSGMERELALYLKINRVQAHEKIWISFDQSMTLLTFLNYFRANYYNGNPILQNTRKQEAHFTEKSWISSSNASFSPPL
jgi:hypothetical protein